MSDQLYTIRRESRAALAAETPVLLHFLDGYIDAGQVAHGAGKYILEQCEYDELIRFNIDTLHDFRARRPQFGFDTDHWVSRKDPELVIYSVVDAAQQRFLMLKGVEPDNRWFSAAKAVMEICAEFEVRMLATAHGVPMAVPHTRPTLITQHATSPEIVSGNPLWLDQLQVPGGFSHMLEYEAGEHDRLGVGFVAHVPHYLSQGSFYQAIYTALSRLNEVCELQIPLEALSQRVDENLQEIAEEAAAAEGEFNALVAALEEQYDQLQESGAASVPSANEIGAAVEQFLAEQDQTSEPFGEG